MEPVRRILAPMDFSKGAAAAIDHAIGFARRFDAALHVTHIFDVPLYHADAMVQIGSGPPMTLVDHMRADLGKMLDDFIAPLDLHGVVLSRSLEIGPTIDTIVRLSEDYDLVVMGTHGRKGFKRWVMGSVAEQVVRECACPVLVVHAPHED